MRTKPGFLLLIVILIKYLLDYFKQYNAMPLPKNEDIFIRIPKK